MDPVSHEAGQELTGLDFQGGVGCPPTAGQSFHLGSAPWTALPLAPTDSLQAKLHGLWPLGCAGHVHHCSPELSTMGLHMGLFPTA